MFLKAHMKGKAGEMAQHLTLAVADDPGTVSSTHIGWLSTTCNCPFLWATPAPRPKHTHIKRRYIIKRHTRAVTCWALPKCCKMRFFFFLLPFLQTSISRAVQLADRGTAARHSLKMERLCQGDSILHLRRQAEWIICS